MQRTTELRRSCRLSTRQQQPPTLEYAGTGNGNGVLHAPDSALSCIRPEVNHLPNLIIGDSNSAAKTHFHRKKKGCVTRPPNAFMLFRSDFWAKEKLKTEPIERDHRDISRIAALCWNNLDDEIRAIYQKKAEERKQIHRLQYPEYKYSPVRKEYLSHKRKRCKKSGGAEERCKKLAFRIIAEFQPDNSVRVEDEEAERPDQKANRISHNAFDSSIRTSFTQGNASDVGTTDTEETARKDSKANDQADASDICAASLLSEKVSVPLIESSQVLTVSKESQVKLYPPIHSAVDIYFGSKPHIEQYIPRLHTWVPQGSDYDPVLSQLVWEAKEQVSSHWDNTHTTSQMNNKPEVVDSFIPPVEEMIYSDIEMEEYFKFDSL